MSVADLLRRITPHEAMAALDAATDKKGPPRWNATGPHNPQED